LVAVNAAAAGRRLAAAALLSLAGITTCKRMALLPRMKISWRVGHCSSLSRALLLAGAATLRECQQMNRKLHLQHFLR
jgi:hypothetical protein